MGSDGGVFVVSAIVLPLPEFDRIMENRIIKTGRQDGVVFMILFPMILSIFGILSFRSALSEFARGDYTLATLCSPLCCDDVPSLTSRGLISGRLTFAPVWTTLEGDESSPSCRPGAEPVPFAAAELKTGLHALDYVAVALYLVLTAAIVVWASRREKDTEDFFLGGRSMPWLAVGLSIMATLLSSITYLGMPGEIVKNGVAILAMQLAIFPVMIIVVWVLIPFFMRLRFTSAYEYLERRFDYRARLLGGVLFLLRWGVDWEKMAFKGMSTMPGTALFKIGDLSTIWVIANIYEYELPFIKIGDTAQITLASFPGEAFQGAITYIYPSLDPKTRAAKVRFDLPNPEYKLKPEMWANVELKIPLGRKLVVPEDAVMDSGTMQMVFVDQGQGQFESRHIQVGSKVQGYYEVLSGLKEGEKVVTSANFLIDSESQLKGGRGGMAGHQHGSMEKK